MRYQTANEICAARRGSFDGSSLNVGTARVGMNQRQGRLCPLDPISVRARQIRPGVSGCSEDSEVLRRQCRRHHHRCRLVEDFGSRRANSESDSANPRANPGVRSKSASDLWQNGRRRLRGVENPQCRSIHDRQRGDALRRKARRVAGRRDSGEPRAHDELPTSRATTGANRSTKTATPRSFGWSPSG